jgi:hypothetical protein
MWVVLCFLEHSISKAPHFLLLLLQRLLFLTMMAPSPQSFGGHVTFFLDFGGSGVWIVSEPIVLILRVWQAHRMGKDDGFKRWDTQQRSFGFSTWV